jgi:hypothetical protein
VDGGELPVARRCPFVDGLVAAVGDGLVGSGGVVGHGAVGASDEGLRAVHLVGDGPPPAPADAPVLLLALLALLELLHAALVQLQRLALRNSHVLDAVGQLDELVVGLQLLRRHPLIAVNQGSADHLLLSRVDLLHCLPELLHELLHPAERQLHHRSYRVVVPRCVAK